MVFLVTHVDESEGVRGDTPRIVELAISCTLASKRTQEATLRVKYLGMKI